MTLIIKAPLLADHILIVDDTEEFAKLLKMMLDGQGQVDLAFNGIEGLQKLDEQDYDLIVTDVEMPVMDGLSFYLRVTQAHPSTKGKFLFMTGDASPERLAFFEKHGIQHLIKPASGKEIRIAAAKILLLKAKVESA